jgi:16S rRNA (cytosine967-C5)-methyltransferase
LMKNEGSIIAVDKYESKLKLIQTSCKRLGISNIELKIADATEVELPPADKILVDAPCSGLGVLRKKPDIKWKRQPEDITRLVVIQSRLLDNAVRLLRPGGVIVYATCTTEPEENILLVRSFLDRHPDFRLDPASPFVNKSVVAEDGSIQTFPHRHQVDGSFAVRLVHTINS